MTSYPVEAGWKEEDTSREAAETVDAVGLRALVVECLKEPSNLLGLTADECAAELELSVLAIRPRFSELRALGVIEDTGDRRLNVSGRWAKVWALTLTLD